MTQAYNISQLANNLNSSGQLDATDGLVNAVPVANGGTGASSSSAARSNLGLGSISTQNADSVSITGGSITGITDLTVADGGTGVSSLSGVVYGNGSSAFTAATGSQIASAIGTSFVANATFATTATTATNSTNGLGVGQTWQSFTSSRTSGTTYTNSTAKPISVSISCGAPYQFANVTVQVDGISIASYNISAGSSGYSFIVPSGSTYSVTSPQIVSWVELR